MKVTLTKSGPGSSLWGRELPKKGNLLVLLVAFMIVVAPVVLVHAPPADGTPPTINPPSIQPASPSSSDTVTVSVVVRDLGSQATGVKNVSIVYSTDSWQSVNTTLGAPYNATSETATAQIPPSSANVTYYVIAFDYAGNMAVNNNNGDYFTYGIPAPAYVSTIAYIIVGAAIAAGVSLIAFMMLRKPSKSTTTARTGYANPDESSQS